MIGKARDWEIWALHLLRPLDVEITDAWGHIVLSCCPIAPTRYLAVVAIRCEGRNAEWYDMYRRFGIYGYQWLAYSTADEMRGLYE